MWSDENVQKCKDIAEYVGLWSWLSNHTANYYERWNVVITIIVALGTFIFSASGIPAVLASDTVINQYITMSVNICVLPFSLLSIFQLIIRLDSKTVDTKTCALQCKILFIKIKKELLLPIEKRREFEVFYNEIVENKSEIEEILTAPPRCIKARFIKKFNREIPEFKKTDEVVEFELKDFNKRKIKIELANKKKERYKLEEYHL